MIASTPAMATDGPVSVTLGVPASARALIWQTFFVEAERGVDFATHLPWHGDAATRTVLLREDDRVIAAAVVRPARQAGVAMVGYVCVDASVRGKGYGRRLISSVRHVADALEYRALLLWTGKPDVYAGQDFAVIGQDEFLQVERVAADGTIPNAFHTVAWPGADDTTGLPAFANSGRHLRSDRARAIVVQGNRGATLIDWSGPAADVAALIDADGHVVWGVNLSVEHNFAEALPVGRYRLQRRPGATAMAYRADPAFALAPIPVIDRI